MGHTFVVHYSEVALKGKNRPEFVRLLRKNVLRALWGLEPVIEHRDGRFLVTTPAEPTEAGARLSRVFGVAWFARANACRAEYGDILKTAMAAAHDSSASTFKVDVRRSDKSFAMSSHELASKLGGEIIAATGKSVDLSNPQLTVRVDVIRGSAVVYSEKIRGPGGLPVGSAGRVMHLFSGGIDSPVAAWLLMKRGCRPVYVHFYLAPTPDYAIKSKITELLKILSQFGGKSTVILVPFAEYQLATSGAPGELEPSLFRRFMRVTAELLAPQFEASGISTGDSLSQAASQTIWNLGTFDRGSTLPVLRPLLTYDKEEVVSLAKAIGTYEISLGEYKDCCAIVTRHPRTRAKEADVTDFARDLGFEELARKTLAQATLLTYSPVGDETKVIPLAQALAQASPDPPMPPEATALGR